MVGGFLVTRWWNIGSLPSDNDSLLAGTSAIYFDDFPIGMPNLAAVAPAFPTVTHRNHHCP